MIAFEFFAPRFPGGLLAVIGMTSAFFHWSEHGIHVVGAVPSGLPQLSVPHLDLSDVMLVLPI
jgi:MFS superfamily sulfate permease-like transporter